MFQSLCFMYGSFSPLCAWVCHSILQCNAQLLSSIAEIGSVFYIPLKLFSWYSTIYSQVIIIWGLFYFIFFKPTPVFHVGSFILRACTLIELNFQTSCEWAVCVVFPYTWPIQQTCSTQELICAFTELHRWNLVLWSCRPLVMMQPLFCLWSTSRFSNSKYSRLEGGCYEFQVVFVFVF